MNQLLAEELLSSENDLGESFFASILQKLPFSK